MMIKTQMVYPEHDAVHQEYTTIISITLDPLVDLGADDHDDAAYIVVAGSTEQEVKEKAIQQMVELQKQLSYEINYLGRR